ncbi:fimbria/pilus outer membrane usher protein, partial [Ralstonia mannitolilytica]|uniref:fimbria/pilus outer membrane usher protein n=1 Tax=Ralstonia mannitolilytica TaxID=105219 RepID=UPI00292F4B10
MRILYAKTFTSTNTNFTLAAYRYSTSGYRTFNDHVNDLSNNPSNDWFNASGFRGGRSRSRIDLTTSQDLGGVDRRYGSVYLNLSQQTFWNQPGSSRSVSVGYRRACPAAPRPTRSRPPESTQPPLQPLGALRCGRSRP